MEQPKPMTNKTRTKRYRVFHQGGAMDWHKSLDGAMRAIMSNTGCGYIRELNDKGECVREIAIVSNEAND